MLYIKENREGNFKHIEKVNNPRMETCDTQ